MLKEVRLAYMMGLLFGALIGGTVTLWLIS
jgi:hypothetical protein